MHFVSIASASRDANRADDQPITRRRIIERGVYTFVASLFPSYGHDPRIAEALENAQQDEVRANANGNVCKKKKKFILTQVISQWLDYSHGGMRGGIAKSIDSVPPSILNSCDIGP